MFGHIGPLVCETAEDQLGQLEGEVDKESQEAHRVRRETLEHRKTVIIIMLRKRRMYDWLESYVQVMPLGER